MTQDQDLRSQVDELDNAILVALERRAKLAREIAARRDQDPTGYSPKPERELLDRLEKAGAGDFPKRAVRAVFREIFSACSSIEAKLRVAFEGPPGSAGHEAARKRFGASAEYLACEGPRFAVDLVSRGHADVALVCLESSREGLLQPTLDALADSDLKIVDTPEHHIRIHVLNHTGNLQDVDKLYAAPAERTTCARFLAGNLPRASLLDTRTSEMAAQLAAEDHGAAALGTEVLAEVYGLLVARANVADEAGENMRCAVLSTRPTARTGDDISALVLTLEDAPGALFRVLQPLADKGINLRRIQSRPRPQGENASRTFRFFLEVQGHVTDRAVVTALEEVKRSVRDLKILGSYPSQH